MGKVKYLNRIREIENRLDASIEDFLYQLHWGEDMKHKEIANLMTLSRPSVTRLFHRLNVPTQSCHRFTDKNLTSWLYKTGRLEKKIGYEGPDRRIQRTKGNVNIDFFKKWTPGMTYVLGFFAADGGMFVNSGGSKYLQFTSTDYEILEKIANLLSAKQKISLKKKSSKNQKNCYLLQIGSKEMFNDLIRFGFTPKKDISLKFPKIPDRYLNHFIRGYFDGDGSISHGYYNRKNRKSKAHVVFLVFTSGSGTFLKELSLKLRKILALNKGYYYRSKKGNSKWLQYGKKEARKICDFMYSGLTSPCYLSRKYSKFKEIFN